MNIVNYFKEDKVKFILHAASLLFGLISFVVYLATGVVRGFTDTYSAGLIVFLVISILLGGVNLFTRIPTLDIIPFALYIICMLLFLQVNANYIVAVVRQIDVTSFSAGFILTIIFLLIASVTNIVGVFYHFNSWLKKA